MDWCPPVAQNQQSYLSQLVYYYNRVKDPMSKNVARSIVLNLIKTRKQRLFDFIDR